MPALHPQIIVIESVETARLAMVAALRAKGHSVRGISQADVLGGALRTGTTDIVVLCQGGGESLSLMRHVRVLLPDSGIIMLTPGARQHDKVDGYDSGADIYLTKPASFEELSAAIHALSRRICPALARPVVGLPLTLYSTTLQLRGAAATVDVSDVECGLLSALATAHEQRMPTERLLEVACRNSAEPTKSALEVQIVRLRKKLEQAGAGTPSIKVIRGMGYQLCVPISVTNRFPTTRHA